MKFPHALRRPAGNDRGMALILSIFLLLFIALFGMIGITIANREVDGAGTQHRAQQYLDQTQTGLDAALLNSSSWLPALLNASVPVKNAESTTQEKDPNGKVLANITAWDIQDTSTYRANQEPLPVQPHQTEPPAGSGYSVGKFQILRFAVTATATGPDGKTYKIREGVWRAFNKDNN